MIEKPYANFFNRLDKIKNDGEKILNYSQEISKTNRVLREQIRTMEARHEAERRVLNSLIEDFKAKAAREAAQQVRDKDLQAAEEG